MLWAKGPGGATNTYSNLGASFASMRVTWTPTTLPSVAPAITSTAPTATGTVGTPYDFACTATGTAPITFTALGLPPGLAISPAGAITGTPTTAGSFTGTITAANGTLPNATQPFSISISVVPTSVTAVQVQASGTELVLSGSGPANGSYSVLVSTNLSQAAAQWTSVATNSIDASGSFRFTNAMDSTAVQRFYQLRVP